MQTNEALESIATKYFPLDLL